MTHADIYNFGKVEVDGTEYFICSDTETAIGEIKRDKQLWGQEPNIERVYGGKLYHKIGRIIAESLGNDGGKVYADALYNGVVSQVYKLS